MSSRAAAEVWVKAFIQEHYGTVPHRSHLSDAYLAGHRRGLEDAAKVADEHAIRVSWVTGGYAEAVARDIRALWEDGR